MNQKSVAVIATPDEKQMAMVVDVCNKCHIQSVGINNLDSLLEQVKEKEFTLLIISNKITENNLCEKIVSIRNIALDKYLPVIALCSHIPEISQEEMKPLIRAPFDLLFYPTHPSLLACKIHMIRTLEYQKMTLQAESQKRMLSMSVKKAFLNSLTYEIRTPINSIIGMSELLMDDNLPQKQMQYTQSIRRSGELLLYLFNTMVDYANIQSGELKIESKPFDPQNIIKKVVGILSGHLKAKRTELIENIDPALPRAMIGDPYRFEQLLFNMLLVTIQQTINNSIILNVQIQSIHNDKIKLYISTEDDNMDLTENQQNSLQFSSDMDVNDLHIGLTITRMIAIKMGGNTGFFKSTDKRTELWCTVNLIKTTHQLHPHCDIADEMEKELFSCSALTPDEIRILMVEDTPINQLLAKRVLAKEGFSQVDIADNGEEAIKALETKDYDLVLMDIFMPVMNGLEASRLIRSQKTIRNPEIPIIALSAQDANLQEDYSDYGISSFMLKPFEIDRFISVAQEFFPRLFMGNGNDEKSAPEPIQVEAKDKLPIFDKKGLLERLEGDESLYQELMQGFLSDIPVQINKIEKSLDFDDMKTAEQLAHTLKGAFSNVGAYLLQEKSKNLETLIKNEDLEKIKPALRDLIKAFNNIQHYI